MKKQDLEQLKKDLGNVTDHELITVLETHKETFLVETYEIPGLLGAVKLFQFRNTFIIHSVIPGLEERLTLPLDRLTAVKCFILETFRLKAHLESFN